MSVPDWILRGYAASQVPEFEAFARACRQNSPALQPPPAFTAEAVSDVEIETKPSEPLQTSSQLSLSALLEKAGFAVTPTPEGAYVVTWMDTGEKCKALVAQQDQTLLVMLSFTAPTDQLDFLLPSTMISRFDDYRVPHELSDRSEEWWIMARHLQPILLVEDSPAVPEALTGFQLVQRWNRTGGWTPESLWNCVMTTLAQLRHYQLATKMPSALLAAPKHYSAPSFLSAHRAEGRPVSWWVDFDLPDLVTERWSWNKRSDQIYDCVLSLKDIGLPNLRVCLQLTQATPDDSPGLMIWGYTIDFDALGHYPALLEYNLSSPLELFQGKRLTLSLDEDGDLLFRAIVVAPQRPDPALVSSIILAGIKSLIGATGYALKQDISV